MVMSDMVRIGTHRVRHSYQFAFLCFAAKKKMNMIIQTNIVGYMNIEFIRLTEVNKSDIIALMSNQIVLNHMPLATAQFGEEECDKFIEEKENIWKEHGYGPWAFIINGNFIGWGGLQPEHNDIEIALVLHPNYWGIGKIIYDKIIHYAFEDLNLKAVIVLLPPSRKHVKGLFKLGFEKDGNIEIDGKLFLRYRLSVLKYNSKKKKFNN